LKGKKRNSTKRGAISSEFLDSCKNPEPIDHSSHSFIPAVSNPPLPRLPFGEKISTSSRDHKSYADRLQRANPSLNEFAPSGDSKEFNSKVAVMHINGVKLVAGANTSVNMESCHSNEINLVIPFSGSVSQVVDGDKHDYGANQGAMLLPAQGRKGRSTVGGSVLLTLDPQRIQQTVQAMLGAEASTPIDLRLQHARVLPWHQGDVAFDATFRHLYGLIDSLCEHPDVLANLGIDDVLYRQASLMLRPDLFFQQDTQYQYRFNKNIATHRIVDTAVAYIERHLTERITLSDLERVSNASARVLQYTFMARFGCSPMNWIRQQRMEMARTRLLASRNGESVTQIALECGFHAPSKFAMAYRKMYGELPSESLKR
jgi:AraC-like DNA-binding protein